MLTLSYCCVTTHPNVTHHQQIVRWFHVCDNVKVLDASFSYQLV